MASASTDTELRTAIQAASSADPTITLTATTFQSVTTLAKLPSYLAQPAVAYNGYIINGAGIALTIINNTRIYQQNIDGGYAPGIVGNLRLHYTAAANNATAIFAATQ